MALVERDRERAAVTATVESGGVLVIEGGAGIGKTALLAAGCEQAAEAGYEVLRARGSELESGFAFGVVSQLFERRVAVGGPAECEALFAGAAAAARPLLSSQLGEGAVRDISFAVLHGLYWVAANLAGTRPVLLAVDDAHWADAPSLRWLAYLAPRVEGLRLSLLVALRPAEPAADEAPLLAVRAEAAVVRPALLSQNAVAGIVQGLAGDVATDEVCSALWRESGGNPFYLHELLRAGSSVDDSVFRLDAGQPLARRSAGLTRQVAARVRRLDPRALRFAQALALLGDDCELRHAAAVADMEPEVAARLAAGLVRLEVLAEDDPPGFLHPVIREAVEASMGNDERDLGHRAAARLLHADGAPPGRVAVHVMRFQPVGDSFAVARLREAAQAAIQSGAPQAAADLLARALAEPPTPVERITLLREIAEAEMLAGLEAACGRLEEALKLTGDPGQRAEIGLELAEAHANLYRWEQAVDVCQRALNDLGERDPALAARLEAELVVCGLRDGRRVAAALPVLARLGARRLDRGPAEAYAVARAMAGLFLDHRPAQEVALPLKAAFERSGPRADNWDVRLPGLVTLIWAEGYSAVQATLDGMLAEAERTGSARGLHVTYVILGLLKLQLGALPEADAAARVALRVLQAADFSQGLPLVASVLADVAVEAGDLAEAEAALTMLPSDGLPPTQPATLVAAVRGRLRLSQGLPDEALIEFETCGSLLSAGLSGPEIRDYGFLHARSGSALALLRMGERERAIELAEGELADARIFSAPRALGIALRVAGLACGGERGLDLLYESVAVLRSSPAALQLAHSLVELGATLRRSGKRAAARELLAEALDLAARCGARPLAARAREELKATGARPRRELRTGAEALTPSELRVARLAAEGRTNREIAESLYVTLKTVEGHLARAYSKLGIAGRSELSQGLGGEKSRVATP